MPSRLVDVTGDDRPDWYRLWSGYEYTLIFVSRSDDSMAPTIAQRIVDQDPRYKYGSVDDYEEMLAAAIESSYDLASDQRDDQTVRRFAGAVLDHIRRYRDAGSASAPPHHPHEPDE